MSASTVSARTPTIPAREFIAAVVDPGSFESWDVQPTPTELSSEYAEVLLAATRRSGTDEAVITGSGILGGRRVAVIAGEFSFLAGSVGLATAERIAAALRRSTAEALPVIASPASGGTRMQEGTPAFLAMVGIAAAIEHHKTAGNPYIVYLRHPTTGGAMASWGSLGHLTFAQPRALLGFLGPRVYEALEGRPFPAGIQTAENLQRCGLVDGIVPLDRLRQLLRKVLDYACGVSDVPGFDSGAEPPAAPTVDPWASVLRTRNKARPGVRELLDFAASDVVLFEGAADSPGDPKAPAGLSSAVLLSLARFGGVRCVVVGQDRRAQAAGVLIGPEALRRARRGMRLAAALKLPLLTVIDTPGAELSAEAEEGGLAREIARCLAYLPTLPVPTLSFILGEGTGGAAIALLPADRTVCSRHGWLSPLAPEGASAILHRDTARAPELTRSLRTSAQELLESGAIDMVVAEEPDAAEEPENFCRRAGRAIERAFVDLLDDAGGTTGERVWGGERIWDGERIWSRAARYGAVFGVGTFR
ncbi:carboxyl transferase domain-containing protein [Arthrobacter sp. NA-172]|uniref:carboxyl transferase domain-containing protein n=1 Tax=Arthrobacter sp. NA-172 TaxID=3367524 RepID=UPI003754064C